MCIYRKFKNSHDSLSRFYLLNYTLCNINLYKNIIKKFNSKFSSFLLSILVKLNTIYLDIFRSELFLSYNFTCVQQIKVISLIHHFIFANNNLGDESNVLGVAKFLNALSSSSCYLVVIIDCFFLRSLHSSRILSLAVF